MLVLENARNVPMFRVTDFLDNGGFTRVMTRNPPYVEMRHTALGGLEAHVHRANTDYRQDMPSSHVYRKAEVTVELYFAWDMNMDNEKLLKLGCSDRHFAEEIKQQFGL